MTKTKQRKLSVSAIFERALGLHKAGHFDQAEQGYCEVLNRQPGHADALQLLGTIEGQRGNTENALALLHRAVETNPLSGHAFNNLGRVLSLANRLEDAYLAFQRALELMPGNAKALDNLGRTMFKLHQMEAALAFFDRALQADPHAINALIHRAEILVRLSSKDPARHDEAVQALHTLREHEHDPEAIAFALAALGAGAAPAITPRQSVERMFDGYADRFDAHLTGVLAYRTPELIGQALQRVAVPAGRMLDLGCGTGLLAPHLKPLGGPLFGVDLSTGMLEKASERGLYDGLACADIVEFLRAIPPGVALVAAADVFVYIGDLGAVFEATARALQAGGIFAFSIEGGSTAADAPDYVLGPARRYAHAQGYVDRLTAQHGFEQLSGDPVVLRKEQQADVAGTVLVLRRRAAN